MRRVLHAASSWNLMQRLKMIKNDCAPQFAFLPLQCSVESEAVKPDSGKKREEWEECVFTVDVFSVLR